MGRHRSAFKEALDLKNKAFALSRLITMNRPSLRRLLSFYPERAWPAAERVQILHRSAHVFPWLAAEFEAQRSRVFTHNIDHVQPSIWAHEGSAERLVAIVRDVVVPGHRVTPVDRSTGAQVHAEAREAVKWATARPSISALRRRVLSDDLTIVIPRMNHFGHLLVDVLMPLFFAVRMLGFSEGERLNVVTGRRPVPLIGAFISALRSAGYAVTHVETRVDQTIQVPRYLHAMCHTRNRENKFATPESIDFAHEHLSIALGRPSDAAPPRLYLQRGPARTRQVAGEAGLIAKLESIGFVPFVARWDNLAEQLAYFRAAETVVAVHGGALANGLWMRPGATLIELMAHDARKSFGLHVASHGGADHHSIFGSKEGPLQHFSIDPDRTFAEIQGIMAVRDLRVRDETRASAVRIGGRRAHDRATTARGLARSE
ncbi:MAG: hypothetical protein JWL93_1908 [Hyphomicrobiales bacterium]|nr:hypothetical protein [Hyphomicrobiales bacterium]